MKKYKEKPNDLAAWSDSDMQSVHAEDEYEAVAEVLEQRGYGYNCSTAPHQPRWGGLAAFTNQDTTWSNYE